MTVAKLIEWLKTQDQAATVRVVLFRDGWCYDSQGAPADIVDFEVNGKLVEYQAACAGYPAELLLGGYRK